MTTVLITVGFVALFFTLMSVRLIFLKNGEFKGTCASQSPFLNKEGVTCSLCGKTVDADSSCANPDNEVDKVMAKFK
ncbi:hypothetical protein J0A68_03870 [Algoriphagus sp. H41]|uniref:Membrane or secreted protein n=1 Tax=Algoriphagus oliviformis TaxID=2811231 RepID=A0ABS3BYZ3_9BACT|nr:hypothetical protein [Algoriphagus oliviformis]MBN7810079.1 hypothetical protein [Algoriphagus oliviformis]